MTKPNYTHLAIVLDRSGSMEGIRTDVIGGLNTFLEEQAKVPGEATVSLSQFDDAYEKLYNFVPISKVEKRTVENYIPRSNTALFDAIGKAIHELGTDLAVLPPVERPSKVIFIVQTDGLENASKEFNAQYIGNLIKRQRERYSWDFVFLGANQDAIMTGEGLNVLRSASATFNSTPLGVATAYVVTSDAVARSRVTNDVMSYTPEEQKNISETK